MTDVSRPVFLSPFDITGLYTEYGVEQLIESHISMARTMVRHMRGEILPPTVYLYCPVDPLTGKSRPGIYMLGCEHDFDTQDNKAAFAVAARLAANMGQAVAACSMTEVWMATRTVRDKTGDEVHAMNQVPPSEDPGRKEAVLLLMVLKSGRKIVRVLEIKRYPPSGAVLTLMDGRDDDLDMLAGLFVDVLKPINPDDLSDLNPYPSVDKAMSQIELDAYQRGKA